MSELDLPALVFDRASVDDLLCALARRRQRLRGRQNVRRSLAVDVDGTPELVIEHREIDAEVQLFRGLPLQVRVTGRCLRIAGGQCAGVDAVEVIGSADLLLTIRPRTGARIHRIGKQRCRRVARRKDSVTRRGTDFLVAVRASAEPELQVVDEMKLEEWLRGDSPADGCRREVAPAIVGAEPGRTVTTRRHRCQVFSSEVVVELGEERSQGPSIAAPADVDVLRSLAQERIGIGRRGEAAAGAEKVLGTVIDVLVTEEEVEVVPLADRASVIGRVSDSY